MTPTDPDVHKIEPRRLSGREGDLIDNAGSALQLISPCDLRCQGEEEFVDEPRHEELAEECRTSFERQVTDPELTLEESAALPMDELGLAARSQLGPVATLLYNAGSGVFADIDAITLDQFESAWRLNAFGALLCAKQVIPEMKAAGSGSIIFIGATASRRGGANSAAFAPAESCAAQPRGIHGAIALAVWHPCGTDRH